MHYFRQNQRAEMVGVLNQIKSHAQEYEQAYKTVGDFYLRMGDGESAIREYREGMSKDVKKKADYQKRIIEVLMRQGKRADAAELNSQILKDNPSDNDARGLAATFMLEKGDVTKAMTELQAVVTRSPENPVAQFNLGRAHAARGEWEQARQHFQKAIDLRPDYLVARLAMAELQISQGDFDAALKTAQQVVSIDPNNNGGRLIESMALMDLKKFVESRQLLEAMLKANPKAPDVLFQLGVLDLAENKYKDAEESFRGAYQLNPANPRGLMGIVETELAQNHPDQAMQLLRTESAKASSWPWVTPPSAPAGSTRPSPITTRSRRRSKKARKPKATCTSASASPTGARAIFPVPSRRCKRPARSSPTTPWSWARWAWCWMAPGAGPKPGRCMKPFSRSIPTTAWC
jgi:tetratricopeptide (TPR) repeat protein